MVGRIRDEDVKRVREAARIEDVVGEHLQLRNAGGGNLKGLCPFHDEKSPSFNVSPSKGFYHCLSGETRVLTYEGVRPIRELAGGTHRILGRDAHWVDAPFRSFGVQPLMKIVLSRNGQTKEIHATDEHRWFVRSGAGRRTMREVLTRDLRTGQSLQSTFPIRRVHSTTPSPFGIAHGIVYGDGTVLGDGTTAYLFQGKDAQLLKWFPNSATRQLEDRIQVLHLPRAFKDLPPLHESVSYLYGWLAGYFAADGHVAKDGTVMLNSARRDDLEQVRAICTRLGIGTYGITHQMREGFAGREPSPLYRIHFVNSCLTEEFFLLDEHRSRFASSAKQFERTSWVVKSVETTDRVEEVFCATVEDGHAFVLEDNILTGNCFGCQEGGDVLDFVMKVEHLTFSETVERLAAQYNIELRYEEGGYNPGRQQGRRTRLVDAHKAAAQFFGEQLGSAEAMVARQFLADRGFTQADAEHFGIGYAPAGWEHLVRFLRGRGFTPEELLTGGLASEGRRGPMDRFRGRLMWPIRDIGGEIIGFGARRLREDDTGPKYLNTPETPIYKKSQVLYGLDLAKKDIARSGRAVVVEGYTDVMACHLSGVTGAIATCGTAFGADHIKVLRRLLMDSGEFRGEVIYTFDGDAAGQKAALRAFDEDQRFVTRTFVAVEPNGMDPCDLRQERGDQAVRDLVDARVPLFEFAIRSRIEGYDLGTAEGRVAALDAAAPIVADIKDQALRHTYAVRLDSWLGFLDEKFVVGRVGQLARWKRERATRGAGQGTGQAPAEQSGAAARAAAPRGFRPDPRDPRQMVQREVLKLALQYPALVARVFDSFGVDEFTVAPYAAARSAIAAAGGTNGPAVHGDWIATVREAAADDGVRALVTELAVEPVRSAGVPDELYAGDNLVRLRTFSADIRIADVKSRLHRLDPSGAPEEYSGTFQELLDLEKYRRSLIDGGATAL